MTRLFLDSSVILAAAGNVQGGSSKILELGVKNKVGLWTSKLALLEAERNIKEKLSNPAFVRFKIILSLSPFSIIKEPTNKFEHRVAKFIYWKDAAILAAAISSKSNYLLTFNRKHFFTDKVKFLLRNTT